MKKLRNKLIYVRGCVKSGKTYHYIKLSFEKQLKDNLGIRYYFLGRRTKEIFINLMFENFEYFRNGEIKL